MTAVAGIAQDGCVWIGADTAGTGGGYGQTVRSDGKVFRNGPMVMGFTSSYRMGQLLRHTLVVPKQYDEPTDTYMVGTFMDAVRTCLKTGGYAKKDNEVESGGTFLIGYDGRLFTIGDDYQVGESAAGYDAVGCGDHLALGSLFTSTGKPKARILTALKAAEAMSAGVRGPFEIVKTKEPS